MAMGGSWSLTVQRRHRQLGDRALGSTSYELVPSGLITENELAAAKTVKMPYLNTQDQQRLIWAPSFALARAYLDQLARSNGLGADTLASARTTLTTTERRPGSERKAALTTLASQLTSAAAASRDEAKVRILATAVTTWLTRKR